MKKIILLFLIFRALNLNALFTSNEFFEFMLPKEFPNDKKLTPNQIEAMKQHQSFVRMLPDVCQCFRCKNYLWDTCGKNSWVKDGKCSYGNETTLADCE
jgi:hypothetical protein